MHDEVRRFLPNSVRRVTEDTVDWLRNRHKVEREARREGAAAKRRPSVRVFRGSGPQRHSGFARAIDGDTLEVDGVRVRLHGIDAPEYEQPCWFHGRHWLCGREATRVLANQLHDRQVVCEIRHRDVYGRASLHAALPEEISTPGWLLRVGPLPTGGTRVPTCQRSRARVRPSAGYGGAKSWRRGIGARASAWQAPKGLRKHRAGGARSRATSARTASVSITSRAAVTTDRPESTVPEVSGGSAPSATREPPDGGGQDSSVDVQADVYRT